MAGIPASRYGSSPARRSAGSPTAALDAVERRHILGTFDAGPSN
jgi:hypothetical protein